MAKRWSSSDTSDDIKCPKCEKLLEKPKLLSCLHCVCSGCIKHELALKQRVVCPLCTCVTEASANDLPTPFHIIDIVNAVENSAKRSSNLCWQCKETRPSHNCSSCGPICTNCVESHKVMKIFESHDLREGEWAEKPTMPQCKRHIEPLELYCTQCLKLCCKQCGCYSKHSDDVLSVKEYDLKDLVSPLKILKTRESDIKNSVDNIASVMNEVSREVKNADEQMEHLWGNLFQALERHRSSIAEKKTAIQSQKLAVLKQQKDELTQLADSIRHIHRVVTLCLQSDNPSSKASCYEFFSSSIQSKLKELENVSSDLRTIQDIKVLQLGTCDISQFLDTHIDIVSPADITKCTIDGIALHSGTVDKVNTFSLQTVYSNSQPCIEDQNVVADLKHCSSGKIISCTAERDSKMTGAYNITYNAADRGRYKLAVSINGENICRSPFDVTMYMCIDKTVEIEPHKKINNLDQPYQLAFTSKNEMFVTQKGSNSIKRLESNGNSSCFNICDREQVSSISKPTGIAINKNDEVYVSYENKGSIVKVNIHGVVQARTSGGELHRPGRLFYSEKTDELFVCERGKDRIRVYDSELKQVREFATKIRCSSVVCDSDGTTYIADKNGCNVHKFSETGVSMGLLFKDKALSAPRGMCLQNGYLFIADRDNSRIVIVGNYSTNPEIVHQFTYCDQDFGSVCSDVDGYVYICNERYNYILVL